MGLDNYAGREKNMARWEPLEARFFALKGLGAYRCKKCGIICYEGEKEQNNNYRTNLDPTSQEAVFN